MKKVIATAVALFMLGSMVACDSSGNERDDSLSREVALLTAQIEALTMEIEALKKQADENEQAKRKLQEQSETIGLLQKKVENLSGVQIAYTAAAPVFAASSCFDFSQTYLISTDDAQDGAFDVYSAAKSYYRNYFRPTLNSDIFLLKPSGTECSWSPQCYDRTYAFYKANGNEFVDALINAKMTLYFEELGGSEYGSEALVPEGYHPWSLRLDAYLLPVPESAISNLGYDLEFGKNDSGAFGMKNYVNVYVRKNCIATCYYEASVYISYTWFKQYFIKNLIREQ